VRLIGSLLGACENDRLDPRQDHAGMTIKRSVQIENDWMRLLMGSFVMNGFPIGALGNDNEEKEGDDNIKSLDLNTD